MKHSKADAKFSQKSQIGNVNVCKSVKYANTDEAILYLKGK